MAPPVAFRKKPRIYVESQRFSTLKGYATASAAALTGDDHEVRRRLEAGGDDECCRGTLDCPVLSCVCNCRADAGTMRRMCLFRGNVTFRFSPVSDRTSGIGPHLTPVQGWA